MIGILDTFWHRFLKKPYTLHCKIDSGAGQPIVFLHGIASQASVWQHTTQLLREQPCRVVAYDLLGFGESPKPHWVQYTVDDHAKAVIATIKKQKIRKPVVIVGHSMGCLVAVRIAKLRPRLVKHLILYEMPIYEGLPDTRIYNRRRDFYYALYSRVINTPELALMSRQTTRSLIAKLSGFEVTTQTWQPFVRSLQNTIINQTTLQDMRTLNVQTDVVYGTFDALVIKGRPRDIFGNSVTNISTHTIAEVHAVTPKASRQIVRLLAAYLAEKPLGQ